MIHLILCPSTCALVNRVADRAPVQVAARDGGDQPDRAKDLIGGADNAYAMR